MEKTILPLTLKKQWFEMIRSGIKLEEYREIKPYWESRFIDSKKQAILDATTADEVAWKEFTHIRFTHGYAKNAPTFLIEFYGFDIGYGYPFWGGMSGNEVFILKLGKIIDNE